MHCPDGRPLDEDGRIERELKHVTPGQKSSFESRWKKGLKFAVPIVAPMIGEAIGKEALSSVAKHSLCGLGALAKISRETFKKSGKLAGSGAKLAVKTSKLAGSGTKMAAKTLYRTGTYAGKTLAKSTAVAGGVWTGFLLMSVVLSTVPV